MIPVSLPLSGVRREGVGAGETLVQRETELPQPAV